MVEGLSQGFYCYSDSLWPKAGWGRNGFIQVMIPNHSSSSEEVGTGTQAGQEPGGRSMYKCLIDSTSHLSKGEDLIRVLGPRNR